MLKLTMNPRKRSKRNRSIPYKLRLPRRENSIESDEAEQNTEKEMLKDQLRAMLQQEASGSYSCADYLSMTAWNQNFMKMNKNLPPPHHRHSGVVNNNRIDEYCREQIVEWSFRVVDYFRIDREVVAFSLSFLDRFLSACRCDRSSFKLAATTTLHLAVKLLYPCKLADLGILSDLSRGEFDMQDVSEMEFRILQSLSWNLHPPTAIAFGSIFLDYFFASAECHLSVADVDDIYEVSSFFSELAVCDYNFVTMKASNIALASVLNALEGMYGPENSMSTFILESAHRVGFWEQLDLSAARNRLWELYERSEEFALHNERIPDSDQLWPHNNNVFVKKATSQMSPVCVAKPCHSAGEFYPESQTPNHFHPTSTHHFRNDSW